MNRFYSTCDLFDPSYFLCSQTSLLLKPYSSPFIEEPIFPLHFLNPNPNPNPFEIPPHCLPHLNPLDLFESATDLIEIHGTPFSASFRRFHHRSVPDPCLKSLCDRVSALELGFDRVLSRTIDGGDRTYKWTAEMKGPEKRSGVDQKYKLVAEIKGGKKDLCGREVERAERSYKWTAEIKGKGKDAPISRTYTFTASTAPAAKESKKDLKERKKGLKCGARVVEIEDTDHPAIALRQAFARSRAAGAGGSKGKKKELSPQDAALIIQMSFRAHLVRRSQVLRELRELAVAKAKLKELRVLFSNFSYHCRCIAADPEERQRFSEKIIVLLLTVDAIQGSDHTVRAAKRSMVVELENMLDVVDPQPPGKQGSMKRRKFDLPENGPIHKALAMGVSEVVQMLDQEDNGSNDFPKAF